MKNVFLLILITPLFAISQGMKFETGLTWAQIQAKAKAENKYIFMDAYTTWCGPCKQMANNIFPMKEVGDFFNVKFINVKVQLDTTADDNAEVKSWYKDGHEILTKYRVSAFPTYLYFDPNGKIIHRAVGATPADRFIAKALDALNPEKQYYVLLQQYLDGKNDPDFLRKVAAVAQDAYDNFYSKKLYKEYLATQTDYTTPENLIFLNRFTKTSRDTGFKVIMENAEKFDAIRGRGMANRKIVDIIMSESVNPLVFSSNAKPDFPSILTKLLKKYPNHAGEAVATARITYYRNQQDWVNYQAAVLDYMIDYSSIPTPDQLNVFAKTIFEYCTDVECMKQALKWSKWSIDSKPNPAYYNTYAGILYKLGQNEEAIEWQEKALATTQNNKEYYQIVLEKMRKGEKTWIN